MGELRRTLYAVVETGYQGYPPGRAFDLALVVLAGPFLVVTVAVLAVVVRLKLGTPVFFRQRRPGLHGRPFTLIKFRTMTDARGPDGELLPDAERLTPFGRWLRASSMDELPEFWNVLRGDMSQIGRAHV